MGSDVRDDVAIWEWQCVVCCWKYRIYSYT